jgi:hypothetical protein
MMGEDNKKKPEQNECGGMCKAKKVDGDSEGKVRGLIKAG